VNHIPEEGVKFFKKQTGDNGGRRCPLFLKEEDEFCYYYGQTELLFAG